MATTSSPPTNRLKGKVAIVTGPSVPLSHPPLTSPSPLNPPTPTPKLTLPKPGGASGFGAAIAQRFASEGSRVLITDINAASGERIAASHPGGNMVFERADVTSAADWEGVVRTCLSRFGAGRVDVLVNCAGGSYRNKVCFVLLWGVWG